MPPLSDWPPEIWAHILDFACMDDGTTARSLSLVSRQYRHLSRNHLYYAVKVSSVPQLLKLDDQISKSVLSSEQRSGYSLKTRFLCISLPTPFNLAAYPEESFAPHEIPGDTSYCAEEDDSDSDDGSCYSTESSEDEGSVNDDAGSQQDQSLQEELEAELADITNDPASSGGNFGPGHTVDSLSDLFTNPHYSLDCYTNSVYTSLRRLLDACADTLEIFSLYFYPWKFLPLELFVPALPKLEILSIYIRRTKDRQWVHPRCSLPSPLLQFPSLTELRMIDVCFFYRIVQRELWWADVLQTCPPNIKVITLAEAIRTGNRTSGLKKEDGMEYQFLSRRTIGNIVGRCQGSDVAVQWWLDDMVGSNSVLDITGKPSLHNPEPISLN
ncbi:hypothetical protein MD484_g1352, partial [Candolleomyces efflorescens]